MEEVLLRSLSQTEELSNSPIERLQEISRCIQKEILAHQRSLIRPWLLALLGVCVLAFTYVYARYVPAYREVTYGIGIGLPAIALFTFHIASVMVYTWPATVLAAGGAFAMSFREWRHQRYAWARGDLVLLSACLVIGFGIIVGVFVVQDGFAQLLHELGSPRR